MCKHSDQFGSRPRRSLPRVTTSDPSDLTAMRIDYSGAPFDVTDLAADWWTQLDRWLTDAVATDVTEPNAMVLATASPDGVPTSRNVLAKQVDAAGVAFYTNYHSAKSADLIANPLASATFCWLPLHRQAHVRGRVEKVDAATTLAYWRTRPRGSQLGAWASPQSTVVPDRPALDEMQAEMERRFGGLDSIQEIPVPDHWGGWRIVPHTVEFWQGRRSRMHDRLRFRRIGADNPGASAADAGSWIVERLAP